MKTEKYQVFLPLSPSNQQDSYFIVQILYNKAVIWGSTNYRQFEFASPLTVDMSYKLLI